MLDDPPDTDGDGFNTCNGDCSENNGSVYPGATETCNNVDDDCNGKVDEGFDRDGDGYST